MSSVRADPVKVRQAIAEVETALTLLRESIGNREALLDDDRRYAITLEQRITALRGLEEAAAVPP